MQLEVKSTLAGLVSQIEHMVGGEPPTREDAVERALTSLGNPDGKDMVVPERQQEALAVYMQRFNARRGLYEFAVRILIGTNVFTPSLCTSGWQLWKKPALAGIEKQTVEAAMLKCSNAVSSGLHKLAPIRAHSDTMSALSFAVASIVVFDSALFALSRELRPLIQDMTR
jgi:hypothetical protein